MKMFESVEAGQWEAVPQTSLDQYYDLRFIFGHRFCVSSTVYVQNTHRPYRQTQMGNYAHDAAAISKLHKRLSIITCKNWYSSLE